MGEIVCAFCKGEGKDPFNLLSELSICQVCSGTGRVEVAQPRIRCACCKGTGVYPHNARVTCTVCKGKGMVQVPEGSEKCLRCRGTGRTVDSGLPCIQCGGRGVVGRNKGA